MLAMLVNPIAPLPMKVIDPALVDVNRIIYSLSSLHLDCTADQALQIRDAIRPLPLCDDELLGLVSQYVTTDWDKCPERQEPVLRELENRYRQAETDKSRHWIERQILAATRGLYEHPDWWELPCWCDSCIEDGQ